MVLPTRKAEEPFFLMLLQLGWDFIKDTDYFFGIVAGIVIDTVVIQCEYLTFYPVYVFEVMRVNIFFYSLWHSANNEV